MIYLWFTYYTYELLMKIKNTYNIYDLLRNYLGITYDLLMIYLWFTYLSLMIMIMMTYVTYNLLICYLWMTYFLLMIYLWFTYDLLITLITVLMELFLLMNSITVVSSTQFADEPHEFLWYLCSDIGIRVTGTSHTNNP